MSIRKQFLAHFLGVIFSPTKTFHKLATERHRLKYGLSVMMFVAVLYSLSALIGYFNGFYPQYPVPTIAPFGNLIPQEEYYLWVSILNPFFNLLILVVYASFTQLAAKALGGQGTFEDTLALLGFVTILQIPLMWIPETIIFISGTPHTLWFIFGNPFVDNLRQVATFIWALLVSIIAVKSAHQIPLLKSTVATLVGFIPMTFVALTYIR
jgi:hypothetical protein